MELNFGIVSDGAVAAKPMAGGAPFRLAVLGDFSGGANKGRLEVGDDLARRKPLRVDVDNIDQVMQWNFLTRERFLAAWFVMFSLAGLYLLGFLRLEGVEPGDPMGIGRLLTASALLIFAISLVPGMFGAPLGELDAYVPVATGGMTSGSETSVSTKDLPGQWRRASHQLTARPKGRIINVLRTETHTVNQTSCQSAFAIGRRVRWFA